MQQRYFLFVMGLATILGACSGSSSKTTSCPPSEAPDTHGECRSLCSTADHCLAHESCVDGLCQDGHHGNGDPDDSDTDSDTDNEGGDDDQVTDTDGSDDDESPTDQEPDPDDTTPPTVTNITPSHQATAVNTGTAIVITFSEGIAVASASGITLQKGSTQVSLSGHTQWSSGNTVLTLTPTIEYADEGNAVPQYTLTLPTQIEDVSGNNLATERVSTFSTGRWRSYEVMATTKVYEAEQYFPADEDGLYYREYNVLADTITLDLERVIGGSQPEAVNAIWRYGLVKFPLSTPFAMVLYELSDGGYPFGDNFEAWLDLRVTSASPASAQLKLQHVNISSANESYTDHGQYATAPANSGYNATAVTISQSLTPPTTAGAQSLAVNAALTHESFNLSAYTNGLQFLLSLELTGPTGAGATLSFASPTHATEAWRPKLRIRYVDADDVN